MKIDSKTIAYNGILASLYIALTLITYPISFLGIQIRIAEILILLCFFNKSYILGLTLGCLVANMFSSIGVVDVLFGGIATLISCLLISYCKKLIVAISIPVLINGGLIGLELYLFLKEPFLISFLTVMIGELIAMIVGYLLFFFLRKNKYFYNLIDAKRNIDFKL